jgi:hypothetical protein
VCRGEGHIPGGGGGILFVAPRALVVLRLLVLYENLFIFKRTLAVPAHWLVHALLLAPHLPPLSCVRVCGGGDNNGLFCEKEKAPPTRENNMCKEERKSRKKASRPQQQTCSISVQDLAQWQSDCAGSTSFQRYAPCTLPDLHMSYSPLPLRSICRASFSFQK